MSLVSFDSIGSVDSVVQPINFFIKLTEPIWGLKCTRRWKVLQAFAENKCVHTFYRIETIGKQRNILFKDSFVGFFSLFTLFANTQI